MKTTPINKITEKSFHSLVELLKAYEVSLTNIEIKRDIVYYIKVNLKDSLISLEVILNNVYKILQMFTYPEDPSHKIELKYEVVR